MGQVYEGADVTLVTLVYRSAKWLEWVMRGVESAATEAKYRWLVVANDAEDDVIAHLTTLDIDWVDHRNDNPGEYYINRVYKAWNRGVLEARTPLVVMLNTDMWPYDRWLDSLLWLKKTQPKSVPTSLLVESGRIPSAMPEFVMDCGTDPESFDEMKFRGYANGISRPLETQPGRLFMPILVDRQEFFDVGAYPHGNPIGTTGDKDLIRRYRKAGFPHLTDMGSVAYHVSCGEMMDENP